MKSLKKTTPKCECAAYGKTHSSPDFPHSCGWPIASPEDANCFWAWIGRNSDESGAMPTLSLLKIAELLGVPQSRISELVKEAEENFKNIKELQDLKD
jgi:hypothetical protein